MYYYSDDLSPLPVRSVTKPGDNKSDPNHETATFGLFSTCGRTLRSSCVKRGHPHVFFATRMNGQRVLSGYYHIAWFAPGVFGEENDICLAADYQYFITDPVPLSEIDNACHTDFAGSWRQYRLVDADECECLLEELRSYPNRTEAYLQEIDRLERFNQKHGGHRYVGGWKQSHSFSWGMAEDLLGKNASNAPGELVKNTSPTGLWKCERCDVEIENESLLKRCGECGAVGSLRPVTDS